MNLVLARADLARSSVTDPRPRRNLPREGEPLIDQRPSASEHESAFLNAPVSGLLAECIFGAGVSGVMLSYNHRALTLKRLRYRLVTDLKRQAKRARRALAAPPAVNTVLFIFGCQRSGTTMLSDLFALDPASDVYPERSRLGAEDDPLRLRLAPLGEIAERLKRNAAPLVVVKPLVESQRAAEILAHDPRWRAVWLYRDVRDVVLSNTQMFGGDNGFDDLAPILDGRPDWRSDGLPADVVERIRDLRAAGLERHDAAALFWWTRNHHFFLQSLDREPRLWLCRYEDLVADPIAEMRRIYDRIGRAAPAELARNEVFQTSVGRGGKLELSAQVRALCDEMLARLDAARARQTDASHAQA